MRLLSIALIYVIISCIQAIAAQPSNDECVGAIRLASELGQVCQSSGEGRNVDATQSASAIPSCWPTNSQVGDVWYSFRAVASTISVILTGATAANPQGTLVGPELALYEGGCNGLTELGCGSDAFLSNSTELTITSLTIGQEYYIRVAGRDGAAGTYQLCLNAFNFIPPAESDCNMAVVLCDQSSFSVESLVGTGAEPNEIAGLGLCLPEEAASTWYAWVCQDPGQLTFTLTPNNPNDDLDFILFELPGGLDDCANKRSLRCMASGATINDSPQNFARCAGPTGLRAGETDVIEAAGCGNPADNNFLAPADLVAGRAYALLINNFSESGQGFRIDFGGTSTFAGPEVTLSLDDGQDLDSIACDKEFTISAEVDFEEGTIVSYLWNFGTGAMPPSATGPGPVTVEYSSIGDKVISLTLVSDEGCAFTEVLSIDVLPCCEDFTLVTTSADSVSDLVCFDDGSGFVRLATQGGTPEYEYSADDGVMWQLSNTFAGLDAADYTIRVRDRKGCEDTISVTLMEPEQIIVDAGANQEVGLGCMATVVASVTPSGFNYSYRWTSTDTSFRDPGQPNFTTVPMGPNTYTVVVTNDDGCTAIDSVMLSTDDERPIFIPTAFSPNNDGVNDHFTVYGGKAADEIVMLAVYDRWGAKLFERTNIPLNQTFFGWDGTRDGSVLDPGVYAYVAEVRFLDGVVQTFHGDINLMK